MTIWQILAIIICGPIGLWNLTHVADFYLKKPGGTFSPWTLLGVAVCGVLITLSFTGVQ